jgi:hypothetical protein
MENVSSTTVSRSPAWESQCLKIPLKPGTTERFLAFARSLRDRKAELAATLAREGILSEHVMLERSPQGDCLIFYSRAASLAAANQAFIASTSPLDEETKAVIAETWDVDRAVLLDVLIDIA